MMQLFFSIILCSAQNPDEINEKGQKVTKNAIAGHLEYNFNIVPDWP